MHSQVTPELPQTEDGAPDYPNHPLPSWAAYSIVSWEEDEFVTTHKSPTITVNNMGAYVEQIIGAKTGKHNPVVLIVDKRHRIDGGLGYEDVGDLLYVLNKFQTEILIDFSDGREEAAL